MSKRTDETAPAVMRARQTTKSSTPPIQKVFGGTVDTAGTMPDMQVACIASTSAKDYVGDTIQATGIIGRGNSVPVCVNHDMDRVCGRAVWRYDSNLDGIRATITFADTTLGREIYGLVKSGVLTDVSVGIDALERKPRPGGWDFTKSRLMEISVVTVGAHPAAVITQKSQPATPPTKAERLRRAKALADSVPPEPPAVPMSVQVAKAAQAHATTIQNLQANDLRRREVRQARARAAALARGG